MPTHNATQESCTGVTLTPAAEEKLATINEVAAYLGISARTLYNARCTNRSCPPAVRVLGSLRWKWSDVFAWVDAQAETTEGSK